MKLSSKARYAIMAMMEVAINKGSKPVTLADISEEHGLSISYLEQLFARLRQSKLVQGTRGPGGGYRLAKNPDQISIAEIANSVEDKIRAKKPRHNDQFNNSSYELINDMWDDLSTQINTFLDGHYLGEFVNPHIESSIESSINISADSNIHLLNVPKNKDQQVA